MAYCIFVLKGENSVRGVAGVRQAVSLEPLGENGYHPTHHFLKCSDCPATRMVTGFSNYRQDVYKEVRLQPA